MGNLGAVNFKASDLSKVKRFCLCINKSEYCEYDGICEEKLNTSDSCLCWFCKHMKRDFNIPGIIERIRRNQNVKGDC